VGSTATKVVAKLVPHVGGSNRGWGSGETRVTSHESVSQERGPRLAKPAAAGTGTNYKRKKVALSGHEAKNSWGPLKPSHTHHTPVGDWIWANWELVLVQLLADRHCSVVVVVVHLHTQPKPKTLSHFFTYKSQFIFYQSGYWRHNSILSDDFVLRNVSSMGTLRPARCLCLYGIQGSLNFQTRASKWVHT
jgi:hypothetical protein